MSSSVGKLTWEGNKLFLCYGETHKRRICVAFVLPQPGGYVAISMLEDHNRFQQPTTFADADITKALIEEWVRFVLSDIRQLTSIA
jgi:hypothetical protein